jgi:sterol desaturase/sphingolipid hydroxylase (fatty acid hydroxylase superfamily)
MSDRGAAAFISTLWNPVALLAVLLVALALCEHLRPARPADPSAVRRWLNNSAQFLLFEAANLWLAPLLSFLVQPTFRGMAIESGVRLVVVLVALDALQYLLHRLLHQGWLWRLHAIHHTDLDMDVSTTIRHHPVESLVTAALLAGAATLAGVTPGELAIYGTIEFAVQLLAHANVALPPRLDRAIAWLIVTPGFHHFHHSRDPRQSNANYGQVLTLWDRLFGTLAPGEAPMAFGVGEYLAPRFQSLGTILLQPFLPPPAVR